MDTKRTKVTLETTGKRIDKFLSEEYPEYSRSFIQKLIKEEQVSISGKPVKANYKLTGVEEIVLGIPEQKEPDIIPEDIPLDVLYEDEDVIVVNKPKGMVVHPASGHYSGTLVNALMFHCQDNLSGINGVMRPGIVHRIDQNTTGSLIVCKNDLSHSKISEQLKEHTINRRYRAIVHGNIKEDTGTIRSLIGRHPIDRKKMAVVQKNGKEAITNYTVLERFGNYTYIECKLETGRTHQIRVHMNHIHHPILGDDIYGPAKCPFPNLQGQTLHAYLIGFIHPRTNEYMEFTAPIPDYFEELLDRFRN